MAGAWRKAKRRKNRKPEMSHIAERVKNNPLQPRPQTTFSGQLHEGLQAMGSPRLAIA